jgi:hypothetical protein
LEALKEALLLKASTQTLALDQRRDLDGRRGKRRRRYHGRSCPEADKEKDKGADHHSLLVKFPTLPARPIAAR